MRSQDEREDEPGGVEAHLRALDDMAATLRDDSRASVRICAWCESACVAGEWYDSDRDEWVVVLAGAARLRFEGEPAPRALAPGDWLRIPAHARHRVEWTDPDRATIWLTVHFHTGG